MMKPTDQHLPVIVIGLVLAVIAACQPVAKPPVLPPPLSGDLPIIAPSTITAGDPVNVQVGPVAVTDGTLVGLVMIGNLGPHLYRSAFENGIAMFTIPGEHTLQPGHLALIAASENARGEIGVLLYPEIDTHEQASTGLFDPAI